MLGRQDCVFLDSLLGAFTGYFIVENEALILCRNQTARLMQWKAMRAE